MTQRGIMEQIVRETATPVDRRSGGPRSMPGWIKVSDEGDGLVVSQKLGRLIRQLSDNIYDGDADMAETITRSDWEGEVRRSIAPLLVEHLKKNDHTDDAAGKILGALKSALTAHPQASDTFIFGCAVFSEPFEDIIEIGPVRLVPRRIWINEALAKGWVSPALARYLNRSSDASEEALPEDLVDRDWLMTDALGQAPFVCEVKTCGLIGGAAREKAALAARLAIATLALTWDMPSRALVDMGLLYDGPSYGRAYAFIRNGVTLRGSLGTKLKARGKFLSTPWSEMSQDYAEIFSVAGEVIEYLLSPTGSIARPKLMDVLAHGMIWFHEACRDDMDMIAVTKFVSSIDSLSVGTGGKGGLIRLVTARMGVEPCTPIREGGPTFENALTDLYKNGRSRPLHGSSDRLKLDWTGMRNLAESFGRHTLVLCLDWAAENPHSDNPKAMAFN